MVKILLSADWHIALHRKKIPSEWQADRFRQFFLQLHELEKECDIHILAGDIYDKAPELDEINLFHRFANAATIRTIIIPGNHEATKKGKTFLTSYKEKNAITNSNIEIYTKNTRVKHQEVHFQLFPYGEMQIDNLPSYQEGDILVTHIRGEVPPHITAEYDFNKLRAWPLILLGDLHFAHQYQDYPAFYPGSPMNVSFDRDDTREYGVYIIEYNNLTDFDVHFQSLNLPRLIRKTIDIKDKHNIKSDKYNHVIYEVTGSIDELSNLDKSPLIDKKIVHRPPEDSKLDLSGKISLEEELQIYLEYIKVEDIKTVMKEFGNLNVSEY